MFGVNGMQAEAPEGQADNYLSTSDDLDIFADDMIHPLKRLRKGIVKIRYSKICWDF